MLDKEAISQSRKLSELKSDTSRLVYTWLLSHLDCEGRFSAEPSIIKGLVFPRINSITFKKIENSLFEMVDVGLIEIYEIDGDNYLEYIKFRDYQSLEKSREAPSKIPAPGDNSRVNPSRSALIPLREEKRREEKISKDKYKEHVRLSKTEYSKLLEKLGERSLAHYIENLNNYIGSKGKKYKSHYFTILSWSNKDKKDNVKFNIDNVRLEA